MGKNGKAFHLFTWLGILAHPVKTGLDAWRKSWRIDQFFNKLFEGYLGYDMQNEQWKPESALFTYTMTIGLPVVSILATRFGLNRHMPKWFKL